MQNKKIRNATGCTSNNIKFRSYLERSIYNTLVQMGLNPQYEPERILLWDGFISQVPYYDQETDVQHRKRVEKGDIETARMLTEKSKVVLGITYTPDIYFRYGNLDVYIEVKGIENDVYYIKKKMFLKHLNDKLNQTGQHSIYFEVHTKKQLMQAIDIVKGI